MRPRTAVIVLSLAAVAAFAAPASADPPWTTPVAAGVSQPSLVDFGASGTGVVVESSLLRGRSRSAVIRSGMVGQPSAFPVRFRPQALRVYGSAGLVTAGEESVRGGRANRVVVAFGSVGGRLTSTRTVSRRGIRVRFGGMDASPRGAVAVVWRDGDAVRLAYRPAGRRFRRSVTVARPGSVVGSAVAVNARGDALVAWNGSSRRRGEETAVFARVVRASGRRERVRRLGPSWWNSNVSAAITDDRRGLVAWAPADGGGRVLAALAGAGGRFTRGRVLADVISGLRAAHVDVAFTSAGEGVVAWSSGDPYFGGAAQTRESLVAVAVQRGTGFAPAQTLAAPGRNATLATGPRGETLVTWLASGAGPGDVVAALRPAGGAFGTPERVATGQLSKPLAAFDPTTAVPFVFTGGLVSVRPPL